MMPCPLLTVRCMKGNSDEKGISRLFHLYKEHLEQMHLTAWHVAARSQYQRAWGLTQEYKPVSSGLQGAEAANS